MKHILVVIDMQNDFVDGALGTKEAQKIVPAVIEKIKSYPSGCVYATRDTHQPNYLDTQEGKYLPVSHCIEGTKGWEIKTDIDKALKNKNAVVIDKPTFGSEKLIDALIIESEKNQISIELIGLCTDICVVSNALCLKARMPETPIYIDPLCCAGVTPETHQAAITTMKMCQIQIK